jgi:sulfite exporter TauE/SafE
MFDAETPAIGLPMAAAMGLAFGMGPCLLACFPYLGPVFLGLPGSVRSSWRILLPLSLGRLCAYAVYGAMAGKIGGWAGDLLGEESIRAVTGLAAVAVGGAMLLRRPFRHRCPAFRRGFADGILPGGLFLLGAAMTMTPCAPLSAVMVAAAASGSPAWGGTLGLCFGLGATLIPALVFGAGFAHLGMRLRERLGAWRPPMEAASALLLIACGVSGLLGQ